MGDQWSHFGGTPDQGHPEKSEAQCDNGAPDQGSFEGFIVVRIGDIIILQIVSS